MVYFQYHLKCQYFTDNCGDINLWLMQSIPKIVLHPKQFRLITIEEISALVCCCWVSGWCIFNIALNVSSLLTIQVIINFNWCNKIQRSFLHLKWFILIMIEEISALVSCYWVSGWCTFNIAWNFSFLLTI